MTEKSGKTFELTDKASGRSAQLPVLRRVLAIIEATVDTPLLIEATSRIELAP